MRDLDNPKTIKSADKSNFCQLLLDFPDQCERAFAVGSSSSVPGGWGGIKNVVFTGLGGSAIGGDLLRSYLLKEAKVPIFVNRNYGLPNFVDKDTLLFVGSYSGNTEETLEAYEEGSKKTNKIVVVSSGGRLTEMADRAGALLLSIPSGLPPRAALGYSFFPALAVLSKIGVASDKSLELGENLLSLRRLGERLSPERSCKDNQAKTLASRIYGKFPLIYASNDFFDVVTTRWRTQLAENSKHLASSHVFPELTHNEIVGWVNPEKLIKDFMVLILRDKADHPRIRRRMEITASIIGEMSSPVIDVWSEGKGRLSRIYSLIYIGDFVSFYLAILNGVDPTPVKRIDYLKKELKKG